jgi:probable phosphoglycerate mutase
MNQSLPEVYLARHGETEWSLSGQHTGLTDLPLTPHGEENARRLGKRLKHGTFAKVFTSPLQRARRTGELAGFAGQAEVNPDLVEWNYGAYEGMTSAEILKTRPDWKLFRDGVPNGESLADIGARADRVIARLRAIDGDVLVFSSGHFLRVLAARWLGLEVSEGRYFLLKTASLSVLGYERTRLNPALCLWNDVSHLGD